MATVTFGERKISITLVKPIRIIRMEPAAKRTIALGQKPIRTIRLSNVGIQGSQGFSAFEVWRQQPGNALYDEQDYLDWLANAQIVVVTPYLTATQAARDVALGASATAVAAKNSATTSEANALAYRNTSIDRAIAALAAQEAAELARSQAEAEKNAATAQRQAADYAAGQAAASALTADADAAAANNAKDAANVSAQGSETARAASVVAKDASEAASVISVAKAGEALAHKNAAQAAQSGSEAARDIAVAKALEAATLAAEFDGDTYDRKTDLLASSRLTGMIDPGLIPVLVGQLPVVSSGTIANLTAPQQAGIAAGTLVATVDGRRWVYKGNGSKIDSSNYIEQGDVTPDWTTIANKPTNFVVVDAENTLQGGLTLAAGTATVAPLKFQAGVQLTVAVPHAVEWTGAALSITTAAGVRKTIAYTDSNITGSAASLTTARSISMTGDGTWTTSFNGTANVTGAMTLATVNANVGAFGSATQVGTFTVDAKGRTTAASNVTITPAWGSITAKPTTLAGYGITDALTSGYVPAWAAVTGKPTTVAGYGITDALTTSYVPTWASVSGKPTTLAGYGITNNIAISGAGQAVNFLSVGVSGGYALGTQAGYLYPSGNDVVLRYGATGAERYVSFNADGSCNVLNGNMSVSGSNTGNNFIATGSAYALRMKDNATAGGIATMLYSDTGNFYFLLSANNDANGGFNGLRPLVINKTTGRVSMANGLDVTGGGFNVTGGDTSLNGNVTVGGSTIEVGPGASGGANSALIRRGSIELKEANPYLDLARGTNDWDVRLQSTAGGTGYLYASSHLVVEAQNGGVVFTNGGSGRQSGEILTLNGTQQSLTKSLGFLCTGDKYAQTAGYTTELEIRGGGGAFPAVIAFHRPGAYGAFFGLRSDNEFAVGGWSMGGSSWKVWTERNFDPATKANTSSFSQSNVANTYAQRTGDGGLFATTMQTLAGDGYGLRLWNGSTDYSMFMSAASNPTWGGQVTNVRNGADYHMYFRMTGDNRGWVFFNGSARAMIDGQGNLIASRIATNDEFYCHSNGALYWSIHNQGVKAAGAGGLPYGTIMPVGGGSNGWEGFNLRSDGVLTWMANGGTVGLHHTGNSWLMSADLAGNWTFRGNVTAYSDLRLKKLVGEDGKILNAKERRDNLYDAAILYRRTDSNSDRVRVGFGAQTLRDGANPELVLEADDAMKIATGTGTLSVDYGEATAILAVASKETDDEVARLCAQVEELTRLVNNLLGDEK